MVLYPCSCGSCCYHRHRRSIGRCLWDKTFVSPASKMQKSSSTNELWLSKFKQFLKSNLHGTSTNRDFNIERFSDAHWQYRYRDRRRNRPSVLLQNGRLERDRYRHSIRKLRRGFQHLRLFPALHRRNPIIHPGSRRPVGRRRCRDACRSSGRSPQRNATLRCSIHCGRGRYLEYLLH